MAITKCEVCSGSHCRMLPRTREEVSITSVGECQSPKLRFPADSSEIFPSLCCTTARDRVLYYFSIASPPSLAYALAFETGGSDR